MNFKNHKTEYLMEMLKAINSGKHPFVSRKNDIIKELKRRAPPGCLLVANNERQN